MKQRRTAVIQAETDGFVAFRPETAVASQGDAIELAREDLRNAVELFLACASGGFRVMQRFQSICWREDGAWVGYLPCYPDYWTQGETRADLEEHLVDLHHDLTGGLPSLSEPALHGCNPET